MAYTYGKGTIKKHCYDVFIRAHPSSTQITDLNYPKRGASFNTYYQLYALTQEKGNMLQEIDISNSGDRSNEVLTRNSWYNMDTSNGAITIDFTNTDAGTQIGQNGPPSNSNAQQFEPILYGQEGNVIVFELTDATNTVTITDNAGNDTILEDEGDIAVFRCINQETWSASDTDADFDDWELWFFAADGNGANSASYYYTKIGAVEENPTIKTSEGDSIKTSINENIITSEIVEVEANDLNVNDDNYDFLKNIDSDETNVDIMFFDSRSDRRQVVLNSELNGTYTDGVAPDWRRGSYQGATENATGSPQGDKCQVVSNVAGHPSLVYQGCPIKKDSKIKLEFWARKTSGNGGRLSVHSYGRHHAIPSTTISDATWKKYYKEWSASDNDAILNFRAASAAASGENQIEFCNVYLYTNAPNAIFAEDVVPTVNLEVTGNDINKVTLSCKNEVPEIDTDNLINYDNAITNNSHRETVDDEGAEAEV